MNNRQRVSIGELAAATGVTVSALRHYDDVGVISPVDRVGGNRWFGSEAVGRVNFVRRSQRFGFQLAEIRDILDGSSGLARQRAADKLEDLRAHQIELETVIQLLEEMIACGCQVVSECPAIVEDRY